MNHRLGETAPRSREAASYDFSENCSTNQEALDYRFDAGQSFRGLIDDDTIR